MRYPSLNSEAGIKEVNYSFLHLYSTYVLNGLDDVYPLFWGGLGTGVVTLLSPWIQVLVSFTNTLIDKIRNV